MKTVLITGASSGIGHAAAVKLLADGKHTVYVAARRLERMDDLAELGARPIRMDITDEADVAAAVRRIEEEAGGVDILVNNAGYGLNGTVEDTPIDSARHQFEVNLFGLGRLTQLVLPTMRRKGAGRVINITSVGGKVYVPYAAWYIATKHALEGWSDCLRIELAPFGVDVVVVEPGAIKTEFDQEMMRSLLEHSGDGDYGPAIRAWAKAAPEMMEQTASPPAVLANTIAKAVHARRPKTRYAAGKYSTTMLTIRKWGGD
ncbi:MAG: oxidoreductase, partial [Planctomycetota bacterium]